MFREALSWGGGGGGIEKKKRETNKQQIHSVELVLIHRRKKDPILALYVTC